MFNFFWGWLLLFSVLNNFYKRFFEFAETKIYDVFIVNNYWE
jgi:hypothetical protein